MLLREGADALQRPHRRFAASDIPELCLMWQLTSCWRELLLKLLQQLLRLPQALEQQQQQPETAEEKEQQQQQDLQKQQRAQGPRVLLLALLLLLEVAEGTTKVVVGTPR